MKPKKSYIYKRDKLKMTSLNFIFDAGSNVEQDGKKGTMHFMEHLLCKTFKDMYSKLTECGIEWNAYTSTGNVVVYFSGLSSKLNHDLRIELAKRLTTSIEDYVSEEEFEKEKNVVLQEYYDNVIDTSSAAAMNVFRRYWNNWLPIGKEEDIRNFSYSDMKKTYSEYFKVPARIVEIGPEKTDELESMCNSDKERVHNKFKFGKYGNDMLQVDNSLKTPVYILFKKQVNKSDYPYLQTGLQMLASGMESPYYDELRVKRGLTYYVCEDIMKNIDSGIVSITACTDTEHVDELCSAMENLISDTEKLLTEDRFKNIIEKLKVVREKYKILKYQSAFKYFNITNLKMPNNLDKITLDKVKNVTLKYFKSAIIVKGA